MWRNYLARTFIGCIWRSDGIGSLMWLLNDLGICLPCRLTFLFTKQKMRALLLRRLGFVLPWLTRHCAGMLFVWRCTEAYCTFTTHSHAVYCRHAIQRQETEIHRHAHTHTQKHTNMHSHSMQQRAFTVWWKDELPALYYQDDSSDGNQWEQDESPYQRKKCRHEVCLKTTRRGFLAGLDGHTEDIL